MIYFKKVFFVTRNMEIKFKRPVPLNKLLTVKGRIVEDENSRLLSAKSLIQDKDDNVLAKAKATFAVLHDKDLYLVSSKLKQDMKDLFDKF
jgi:acyl-CoA thioesterase FadM